MWTRTIQFGLPMLIPSIWLNGSEWFFYIVSRAPHYTRRLWKNYSDYSVPAMETGKTIQPVPIAGKRSLFQCLISPSLRKPARTGGSSRRSWMCSRLKGVPMRPTEREEKAWRRWLLGRHEKCPVCGRPLPPNKRSLVKPHRKGAQNTRDVLCAGKKGDNHEHRHS